MCRLQRSAKGCDSRAGSGVLRWRSCPRWRLDLQKRGDEPRRNIQPISCACFGLTDADQILLAISTFPDAETASYRANVSRRKIPACANIIPGVHSNLSLERKIETARRSHGVFQDIQDRQASFEEGCALFILTRSQRYIRQDRRRNLQITALGNR